MTLPADWPQMWRVMDRACRKYFDMEYLDCSPAMVEFALKQDLAESRARAAAAQAIVDRAETAKADESDCHRRGFTKCLYLAPPIYGPDDEIVGWRMEHVGVVHERRCPRAVAG